MLNRAALIIGTPLVWACSPSGPDVDLKQRLAGLDKIAETACLCEMAAEGANCWDEFNRRVEGVAHTPYGTASVPLTSVVTCYGEVEEYGAEEVCVATRYGLVGGSDENFVCTIEQADELERLWNSNIPPEGGSPTIADEAVKRRIAEIHEEARRSKAS